MFAGYLQRPVATRWATVAAAVALTSSAWSLGVAHADPLPPLPDPTGTISSLEQTAVSTVQQVTSTPTPTPSLAPTPAPAPTGTTTTTTTKRSTQTQPVRVVVRPQHSGSTGTAPTRDSYPAAPQAPPALQMPAVAQLAAYQAEPPAVAGAVPPALAPATTRVPASAIDNIANHSGSPLRALLLTLAAVAAVALASEHMRQLWRLSA